MATVINNPDSGSGAGMIVGVVIAVILVALLVIYGLPALRKNNAPEQGPSASVDINLPAPNNNTGQ